MPKHSSLPRPFRRPLPVVLLCLAGATGCISPSHRQDPHDDSGSWLALLFAVALDDDCD